MNEPIAWAVLATSWAFFGLLVWHIQRLHHKVNRLDAKLAEHLRLDDRYTTEVRVKQENPR